MTIHTVLFDKDGVLVDFHATWAPVTARLLREMAAEAEAEGRGAYETVLDQLAIASGFDLATDCYLPDSPILAGSILDWGPGWAKAVSLRFDEAFLTQMRQRITKLGLESLTPLGAALDVVKTLSDQGFHIGLITNDSEISALAQMKALDLLPIMRFVAASDSGYGRKPAPGQITAYMDQHNEVPASIVLVGDTLHDLEAARAAGIRMIALTPDLEGELAQGACIAISDLRDLGAAIGRL